MSDHYDVCTPGQATALDILAWIQFLDYLFIFLATSLLLVIKFKALSRKKDPLLPQQRKQRQLNNLKQAMTSPFFLILIFSFIRSFNYFLHVINAFVTFNNFLKHFMFVVPLCMLEYLYVFLIKSWMALIGIQPSSFLNPLQTLSLIVCLVSLTTYLLPNSNLIYVIAGTNISVSMILLITSVLMVRSSSKMKDLLGLHSPSNLSRLVKQAWAMGIICSASFSIMAIALVYEAIEDLLDESFSFLCPDPGQGNSEWTSVPFLEGLYCVCTTVPLISLIVLTLRRTQGIRSPESRAFLPSGKGKFN
eukprot:gnl/Dysnectes_brevis/6545_a10239_537.p1 GENE.gnl/Dysnectes_brevis/6545_a10239_537~~gnl/Dysnectes_brevis/6545_a10239_537.p1  ORF type:complete len:305 (+),score=-8.67 gnl/Dysnectes_brevis/6545_a10239_537:33-947(+)